ncbi:unnamed protein product [Absidia cylindrospora]
MTTAKHTNIVEGVQTPPHQEPVRIYFCWQGFYRQAYGTNTTGVPILLLQKDRFHPVLISIFGRDLLNDMHEKLNVGAYGKEPLQSNMLMLCDFT